MSPKKMGRPPSDNPKTARTEIRMTKEDHAILEDCCNITGKSKSEIVRDGILIIHKKLGRSGKK